MENIEKILTENPDFESVLLQIDGYDKAIIGVDIQSERLIYSISAIIEILKSEGLNTIDAIEYFEFNIRGSYVGESTPILCEDRCLIEE